MIKVDGISLTLNEAETKLRLNPFLSDYFCEGVVAFGTIPSVESIQITYGSKTIELSFGEIVDFGYEFGVTRKIFVLKTSLGTFKCDIEDVLEIPQEMRQNKITNFVWKKNFILFPHQIQKCCHEVFDTEDLIHQIYWNLRLLKTSGNESMLASVIGELNVIEPENVEFSIDQLDFVRCRKRDLFNYTRNLSLSIKSLGEFSKTIKALAKSKEYETPYNGLSEGFSANWKSHLKFLMLRALAKCALLEASYESQLPICDSKDLVFSFSDKLMIANITVDSWKFNRVLNSAPDLEDVATTRDVELSTIKLLHYIKQCESNSISIDDDLGDYYTGYWWNL